MSFTTTALTAKLDSLTSTQDSITSTSQWVLFYHRHAPVIVKEWESYLSSHPKKHLALLYLANDVVQQAKARAKARAKNGESGEKEAGFVSEFGNVLNKVVNDVYNQSEKDAKNRVVKLVKVWRDRAIFDNVIELNGAEVTATNTEKVNPTVVKESRSEKEGRPTAEFVLNKFQRWYHESLANKDLQEIDKLKKVLKDTISELQEFEEDIDQESKGKQQRQAKVDEERRKTLELLKKRQEEETLLPTYEDNSDSDSDTDSDNRVRQNDTEDEPKPVKKLRFAE